MYWAFLVVQMVKNLPAMQVTWVRSLAGEDPLEKGMVYLLQYSGLENPVDKGSWRTTIHGVTELDMTLPLNNNKEVKVSVAQSCLTLCDPMDYSLPGSSVHGILQARILEWVAISYNRGSS